MWWTRVNTNHVKVFLAPVLMYLFLVSRNTLTLCKDNTHMRNQTHAQTWVVILKKTFDIANLTRLHIHKYHIGVITYWMHMTIMQSIILIRYLFLIVTILNNTVNPNEKRVLLEHHKWKQFVSPKNQIVNFVKISNYN